MIPNRAKHHICKHSITFCSISEVFQLRRVFEHHLMTVKNLNIQYKFHYIPYLKEQETDATDFTIQQEHILRS